MEPLLKPQGATDSIDTKARGLHGQRARCRDCNEAKGSTSSSACDWSQSARSAPVKWASRLPGQDTSEDGRGLAIDAEVARRLETLDRTELSPCACPFWQG